MPARGGPSLGPPLAPGDEQSEEQATTKKDALDDALGDLNIQRDRMRRGAAGLTFPAVRAVVQEIFTALLFAQKPRYMHWMEQAKHRLQLRI